jgi:hypothetical protein
MTDATARLIEELRDQLRSVRREIYLTEERINALFERRRPHVGLRGSMDGRQMSVRFNERAAS